MATNGGTSERGIKSPRGPHGDVMSRALRQIRNGKTWLKKGMRAAVIGRSKSDPNAIQRKKEHKWERKKGNDAARER